MPGVADPSLAGDGQTARSSVISRAFGGAPRHIDCTTRGMPNQLQDLSDDELVTASGGSLNGATFGALALLNASGMTTDPSSSVAKALQDPPPIVRIQPMPSAPAPSGSGSKPGS